MLRRSHKKSKDGCRECKRRHVKCDEARPSCRLCVLSDRTCTYTTQKPSPQAAERSGSSTPSHGTSRHGTAQPDGFEELGSLNPLRPNFPGLLATPSPSGHFAGSPETPRSNPPGDVDLDHAQLLIHLFLQFPDGDLFVLSDSVQDQHWAMKMAFDIAQASPFLLHALLAFSACHLSHMHPTSSKYQHLAVDLQTRAVTLFNISGPEITPENCVPMLLFSTIMGQHLFADLLRPRDFNGLGSFIQRFGHCLALQKGISVIFLSARPVLMASPIEKVLTAGLEAQRREPTGNDCAELATLIRDSPNLTSAEKDAFVHAMCILQLGFDDILREPHVPTNLCYKLVVGMKQELRLSLEKMQPEALVFLAYYGLLLHYCRKAWLVGTAGAYIIGMVIDYLGSDWASWLEYPRKKMLEDCLG